MSSEHDLGLLLEIEELRRELLLTRQIISDQSKEIARLSRANQEHVGNQAYLSGLHQVLQQKHGQLTDKIREMAGTL